MKFFTRAKGLPAGRQGFTLIELMVVIAIIGILASIISVSLTSARAKGRDAKRVADLKTIQLALEEYYNDNSSYPTAIYGGALNNYLPKLPVDPTDNSTQYSYTSWNAANGGVGSSICTLSLPIGYHLGAGLEDPTNTALTQARHLAPRLSGTNCGGTADFDGRSVTIKNACGLTATLGIPTCYDVTN